MLRAKAFQRRQGEVPEDALPVIAGLVPWSIVERAMASALPQISGEALDQSVLVVRGAKAAGHGR